MKASTERKIIRWIHLILGIPVVGYIYGGIAEQPVAAFITRAVALPLIILSGVWLWKGQQIKKWGNKK
jgi:hypothetical protein